MYIFLSKKIAIPKNSKLSSLEWNEEQGWIACGGENGMLKVLKLDNEPSKSKEGTKLTGVAAPSSLVMNQTLEGHSGSVKIVRWNPSFRKLTSSDETGLIIVWMLHKGTWFEEMINNRNKSVVCDMKWSSDGQKICIVYKDGAVIVGSVDGNRLWGKEIGVELSLIEWSPDARTILFVTQSNKVLLYDSQGNKISDLKLHIKNRSRDSKIVAIEWYRNHSRHHNDISIPTLAFAFSDGRVQLTRGQVDENPVMIDTGMEISQCKWSVDGKFLALGGTANVLSTDGNGSQRSSLLSFYAPNGQHLRSLKVPGDHIGALAWESSGLRFAVAVDQYILFANIRPQYKWARFAETLVYAYNQQDRTESCVVFWNMTTDEKRRKHIGKLLAICSASDMCVLATGTDDGSGQFELVLCNAIGNPIDSKRIDVEPLYVTMTDFHVVAADRETIYVWRYRTQVTHLTSIRTRESSLGLVSGQERVMHIDDSVAEHTNFRDYFQKSKRRQRGNVNDSICAVGASERCLVVARESGTVNRYTLPHISLETKFDMHCRPQKIALNCDATRLSCIDTDGMLTVHDLESSDVSDTASKSGRTDTKIDFHRKDAWDLVWAEDNSELFAVMEKTRMYVFRNFKAEEPILSSGYLSSFKDLRVDVVLMDEIMLRPSKPSKEAVRSFQTKTLRDAKSMLKEVGLKETYGFIEKNPHPQLWRLLAESALNEHDLILADKGFVRCRDYQGVQFVKRLRKMDDKMKQKAEIAAYFQRFEEAEQIYRDMDRKDLAVELRKRIGDWFGVVQLVQSGAGDDELLQLAWNRIGDHYLARQKYEKAMQYYQQAKNTKHLILCHFQLENYDALNDLISDLPEGSEYLSSIGKLMQRVGIHESAVAAYLKANDVKSAIDCCVLLNQWDVAVDLAEKHRYPQIHSLLSKYASNLLSNTGAEGKIRAIELYKKARNSVEAARLLTELAKESADVGHFVRAKKLQVLAAFEVEELRKRALAGENGGEGQDSKVENSATTAQQTLAGLMTLETAATTSGVGGGTSGTRAIDNAWRGAEAYHFFILSLKLLYRGNVRHALECAKELQKYDDILDPKRVYSIVAITSFYTKNFATCSGAFVKLEGMEGISLSERKKYEKLALKIFAKSKPVDASRSTALPGKGRYGRQRICIASGIPLDDRSSGGGRVLTCKRCRHSAFADKLGDFKTCPLCHGTKKDFR